MVILTILLALLLAVAIIVSVVLLAGGIGVIAAFGDIIIFALIIWLLVKLFKRKK